MKTPKNPIKTEQQTHQAIRKSALVPYTYKIKVDENQLNSQKAKPFYVLDFLLRKEHNCLPYFLTITFPNTDLTLTQEWANMVPFLEQLKQTISTRYLCVGGFFALEPHRNTTVKSKRGKNTKAGRPHIHGVLWFMHESLNPDVQYIDFAYSLAGFNTRVQALKTHKDLVASALYTTKQQFQPDIKKVCQEVLGWQSNCALWINQKDTEQPILNLLKDAIPKAHLFEDLFITTPSTPYCQDNQIFLAKLFSKLFALENLAVKDQTIYKPLQNTRYTWKPFMPLKEWVANQFHLDMPTAYLEKLKEALSWLYNQGAKNKNDVTFQIFPTLAPSLYLIEFQDCLYSFDQANTIAFQDVCPSTASVCSEPYAFNDTPLPLKMLFLLYLLVAFGRDNTQEYTAARELLKKSGHTNSAYSTLPFNETRYALMKCSEQENRLTIFFNALESFGSLYHPKHQRKANKALYITGPSNTFKTFLVQTILGKLVGIENIDTISRHSSRFNISHLRKANNIPYVLVLDDFRWQTHSMSTSEFLNFLDGDLVTSEKKFGATQTGSLKGTVAITSNHSIGQGPQGALEQYSKEDLEAFKNRITEINFYSLRAPAFHEIPAHFWTDIADEAIAFSIITNAYLLAKRGPQQTKQQPKPTLPQSFYNAVNHQHQTEDPFEKTGYFLLKHIISEINTVWAK